MRTRRTQRWHAALAAAGTPAEVVAVAHDRLRSGLAWLCRPQPDPESRQRDRDLAASLAADAAEALGSLSSRAEARRKAVTSRAR